MLSRWDPFSELSRMQDDMFKNFATDERPASALAFRPAVDIVEDKEAIWLRAELPGIKTEDVHVELEKNVLTIRGERKSEQKVQKDGFYRFERRHGQFARSFVLPETVDGGAIAADLKDGVLTVRLPKRAAEQPRRISVKGDGPTKDPVGTA
ncbi:MAG: Hsp20/alpha crystallin family protein [Myxococcales bacterium]|nr:Hsp20/alpha crystallin family protein [Myxococcales bacterium]